MDASNHNVSMLAKHTDLSAVLREQEHQEKINSGEDSDSVVDALKLQTFPQGSILHDRFRFGVGIGSRFTPNEIFNLCVKHRPKSILHQPLMHKSKHDETCYAWMRWSDFNMDMVGNLAERIKLKTTLPHGNNVWSIGDLEIDQVNILNKLVKSSRQSIMGLELGCGIGTNMLLKEAHGYCFFGMDNDLEIYANRHELYKRSGKLEYFDALMLRAVETYNVLVINMLQDVYASDIPYFLRRCHRALVENAIVIVPLLPKNERDKPITRGKNKNAGRYFYDEKFIASALNNAGFKTKMITEHNIVSLKRKEVDHVEQE